MASWTHSVSSARRETYPVPSPTT
ncbi:CRISPR-associated protein Cas5 [Streptomyces sp. NBC_01373]